MKKTMISALILLFAYTAYPQGPVNESLKKHYFNLYEQALKYDDLPLAIISLNNVLVEMPTGKESMKYKDTLSILYFNNKMYLPSFLLASEVYKADTINYAALGRMGECYQVNNDFKSAADAFEKAAPALKNPFYYYQLAICQYNLKKPDDCLANADKAAADTNSQNYSVVFNMPNSYSQQVPLKAAALNLKAVLFMDIAKYIKAKEYLQQALAIFPNFEGAKQNAVNCDKSLKELKTKDKIKPKG